MDERVLRDPETYPDEEVIKTALGSSFPAFEELISTVTGAEYGLNPEWRYYKDGGSWLCKVTHKKKTLFWLSVWKGCFKTTFYFTEKTGRGIDDLPIDEALKETFRQSKNVGKLIPLTFQIESTDQLSDLLQVVIYKKSLK